MREPYSEGIANHADLESCAGSGDIAGEGVDRNGQAPAGFRQVFSEME